ncbi:hypothetical protein Godav_013519 [Gossypium davidsonii]|uniref:Uncharacterized protein n=1 Tax=Gossypium davidsonii TaxID=34287 RepID=A0A7J8RGW4_GOSDV|nr:hypothetical protein [Gossypium davidsonii]
MSKNLVGDDGDLISNEDRNTKKVRFKDVDTDTSCEMLVDLIPTPVPSWKDKMLGKTLPASTDEVELNFQEYGHVRDLFPSNGPEKGRGESKEGSTAVAPEKEKSVEASESFRPWMLVERKSRRNQGSNASLAAKFQGKNGEGSRFNALSLVQSETIENGEIGADFSGAASQARVGKDQRGSLKAGNGLSIGLNAGPISVPTSNSNGGNYFQQKINSVMTEPRLQDFNPAQAQINNKETALKGPNSQTFQDANPVSERAGQIHHASTQEHIQVQSTIVAKYVNSENFPAFSTTSEIASGMEQNIQAMEFDGIKAHFNPTFEENLHSKSREHAVGRKFEALEAGSLRNIERKNSSKVGFGESMEAVVNLILSPMVNETGNGVQNEAASNLDGADDS